MLQGPSSLFWPELGDALANHGAKVSKVSVHLGEVVYWGLRKSRPYWGSLSGWDRFLRRYIQREGIDTILYYADRQPYHLVAATLARELGLRAYVIENGYLRPDWITFEPFGMSRYSLFPRDPESIRAIASKSAEPDTRISFSFTFAEEAFNEVLFNLLGYFGHVVFPLYRSDKYYSPLHDYISNLARQLGLKRLNKIATDEMKTIIAQKDRFFVVALQTQGDYQIRDNSPYRHIREMISDVLQSFRSFAEEDVRLVFKIHPHDNGIEKWGPCVRDLASRLDLLKRVSIIDGGNLQHILKAALGCVIINSTVGLHALRAGTPVKVLGSAIYDVPGLTFDGDLDSFWTEVKDVDETLVQDFVRALAGSIQVKGSFYNSAGRKVAIAEIVKRLATFDGYFASKLGRTINDLEPSRTCAEQ